MKLCNISLYFGSSTVTCFLFIIWFNKAGTPDVKPVAANESTAPNKGFAIKSLLIKTYEPILFNNGTADALIELKMFDKESTNPLPVMCFFFREYP